MTSDFDFADVYHRARAAKDPSLMIAALPYAQWLGMEAQFVDGNLRFYLPPIKTNIGNPSLPALHGGAIAGFMEMSAVIHLLMFFNHDPRDNSKAEISPAPQDDPQPKVPKIIDFSIDYLRACRFEDTWCECEMVRQGRRVANMAIRVWQGDPCSPAAAARAHYLLD